MNQRHIESQQRGKWQFIQVCTGTVHCPVAFSGMHICRQHTIRTFKLWFSRGSIRVFFSVLFGFVFGFFNCLTSNLLLCPFQKELII